MAFFEMNLEGAVYVTEKLRTVVAEVATLNLVMPDEVGREVVQDVIFPAVVAHTPVDTGELAANTDYRTAESKPGETRFEIFSLATNERTGYEYAKARAYGFNTVAGSFWTPPESPPYPIAAAEESMDVAKVFAEQGAYDLMMQLTGIWH